MNLALLIEAMRPVVPGLPARQAAEGGAQIPVAAVHHRSDRVTPGTLFVAIRGARADGHAFVADAVSRGAVAVVVEQDVWVPEKAVRIRVTDSRKALALASACFFGRPSRHLVMTGITGTNGKTTIAYLMEQILASGQIKAGVIGTINYRYAGEVFDNPLTTPEAPELQQILADMRSAGVSHAVMEVSSHGLELERVGGCEFDVAVFSNLSQDHLDFHKDMRAYGNAKKRLFTEYLRPAGGEGRAGVAVIHTGDTAGRGLAEELSGCRVIRVGADPENHIYAKDVIFDQSGIRAQIKTPEGEIPIRSRLVGRFNLENILCAVGAALALDVPAAAIKAGIESFANVPGRLEKIDDEAGRHIFVDYAHTPKALANVLETLREINAGRLICVFGCGGDRDADKRAKMGEIAAHLSDVVIITSDNPRTEHPMDIIAAIRTGVHRILPRQVTGAQLAEGDGEQACFVVEPDREQAIFLGIRAARAGDTVLVAGKGHESYQIVGEAVLAFDDRKTARRAIALN